MALRACRAEPEPRVYVIDSIRLQAYEIGALLITLLAFPSETAEERRFAELHASLCTEALIGRARTDAQWANARAVIRPVHFSVPSTIVQANLRSLTRRLRDRMIAGRIANAILFDAAGLNPTLPKGCEGFSIGQLIKMALDDTGQLEAKNAEHRIWRTALPVAHLCAAVQAYLQREDQRAFEVSLGDIIFDEAAISWIVGRTLHTQALMSTRPDRFRPPRAARIVLEAVNIMNSPDS